jgi:hypothetical protein
MNKFGYYATMWYPVWLIVWIVFVPIAMSCLFVYSLYGAVAGFVRTFREEFPKISMPTPSNAKKIHSYYSRIVRRNR